jgi:hypothetical protein
LLKSIYKRPVRRKYSVLTEIIDIFTQACKVCIHDEDVAETDFEHTFETPKGFRSGFRKPCAPPAVGHLETSWDTAPNYLLRDWDRIYGTIFRQRVDNMGIKEVITAPKSPWHNPFVERLIGSIRRDCLDHVIILNENHLSRILI